jgi:hypothetical protein
MVQRMEADQCEREGQSVRVAGRFVLEYFAPPAYAILAQLLNYLQNAANASAVSVEQFEVIFTLFRITKARGINFGADLHSAFVDAIVNLIVNGNMPLHTMLMSFVRLMPTNFHTYAQGEERYNGFELDSGDRSG